VLSQFAVDFPQTKYRVEQFAPGSYSTYTFSDKVCSEWSVISQNTVYHRPGFSKTLYNPREITSSIHEIVDGIQTYLIAAVEKRCCTTERPIACLLSGGLDSSLITALVSEYHKQQGLPPVETYSIGLSESVDLKYAKMVADHLGTKHTEIILTEEDFCEAIPEVIRAIESYDTTTVRASIGNYLLGKYIAKHSEAKVIFNGDGSDELLGGYLYMQNVPDAIEFDKECRRLLKDIHTFDVLRSDKSISSHGLEPRTPFLDRAWTQYYLSISPTLRQFQGQTEKYWLRYAFSKNNYVPLSGLTSILPDKVLWRRKEAFSDGVSGEHRSLYQILQDYCAKMVPLDGSKSYEEMVKQNPKMQKVTTNIPKTAEQYYYRYVFENNYLGMGNIIPYFWMPKYVNATDASARTLTTYQTDSNI
jgi:asparagine synthase (glutamine-hydrolysing)